MDQDQAFTDCINNSYYLIQPGGGMWGDEEREDAEEETMEKQHIEQDGEDKRREEVRRIGVGEEEWQDAGGEQLEVAERESQKEEAQSQGEVSAISTEEVQVIEGDTEKEGEFDNGGAQRGPQDVLQQMISVETQTIPVRQNEATAGEKSQDNMADSCTPVGGNTCRHEENTYPSLSSERIHKAAMEEKTPKNTHPSDRNKSVATNTHVTSLLGKAYLSDLSAPPPLPPPKKEDQTPRSEKVN